MCTWCENNKLSVGRNSDLWMRILDCGLTVSSYSGTRLWEPPSCLLLHPVHIHPVIPCMHLVSAVFWSPVQSTLTFILFPSYCESPPGHYSPAPCLLPGFRSSAMRERVILFNFNHAPACKPLCSPVSLLHIECSTVMCI